MPMTDKYKTDKPLSFKGRGTLPKKKKKPQPKLETYKGISSKIRPAGLLGAKKRR